MNSEIAFKIRTLKSTVDWGVGQRILDFITNSDERLAPQFLKSSWERKFHDFKSVEECESFWAEKSIWRGDKEHYYYAETYSDALFKRRKVVRSDLQITHTFTDRRGNLRAGTLAFSAHYHKVIDWDGLFLGLCNILQSHDAMLHYFGEKEPLWRLDRHIEYENLPHHFLVPGESIKEKTKDLCFYMDSNLVQKISDNGFFIEEMNGGYLIKVTNTVEDMIKDFESFSKRRTQLKALFPETTLRGWKHHLVFAK